MHALLHERVCDRQPRLGGVDPRTRICGTPRSLGAACKRRCTVVVRLATSCCLALGLSVGRQARHAREYNQVPCLTEDRGLRAKRSSDRFVFITSLVSLAEAPEGRAAAEAGGEMDFEIKRNQTRDYWSLMRAF